MSVLSIFIIGIHSFIAWLLIETFVNTCHGLSRSRYIINHYLVVVLSFGGVFALYLRFFGEGAPVFSTTLVAIGISLMIEFVVFRFFYVGECWFLNFVDWIFPVFLATSTIYAVGTL
jgi:hypothetical protein